MPSNQRNDRKPRNGSATKAGRGLIDAMRSWRQKARYATAATTKYPYPNGSCDHVCSIDATVARWKTTRRTMQPPRAMYAFFHDETDRDADATFWDLTHHPASRPIDRHILRA